MNATAMGGGQRPEPGINGNWECEECKNVNFPRRLVLSSCMSVLMCSTIFLFSFQIEYLALQMEECYSYIVLRNKDVNG